MYLPPFNSTPRKLTLGLQFLKTSPSVGKATIKTIFPHISQDCTTECPLFVISSTRHIYKVTMKAEVTQVI
jgi:hypothetical protein